MILKKNMSKISPFMTSKVISEIGQNSAVKSWAGNM